MREVIQLLMGTTPWTRASGRVFVAPIFAICISAFAFSTFSNLDFWTRANLTTVGLISLFVGTWLWIISDTVVVTEGVITKRRLWLKTSLQFAKIRQIQWTPDGVILRTKIGLPFRVSKSQFSSKEELYAFVDSIQRPRDSYVSGTPITAIQCSALLVWPLLTFALLTGKYNTQNTLLMLMYFAAFGCILFGYSQRRIANGTVGTRYLGIPVKHLRLDSVDEVIWEYRESVLGPHEVLTLLRGSKVRRTFRSIDPDYAIIRHVLFQHIPAEKITQRVYDNYGRLIPGATIDKPVRNNLGAAFAPDDLAEDEA